MMRLIENRGTVMSWPVRSLVASVALLTGTLAPAAKAEDCWSNVSGSSGCRAGDWHRLQFKNNCAGGQRTINICVLWTTGPNAGQRNRYGAYATGGQVAVITPGLCQNGSLRYHWRRDGNPPDCP
jgi:hypothetical protein